jgi:hypothetical protein
VHEVQALATLTTILDNIRTNVIDLPAATEANLEKWVREAQRKAESAFQWINGRVELTQATTAGSNDLIDAPALMLWPLGEPFYLTGEIGSKIDMEWLPSINDRADQYNESTDSDLRGAPRALFLVYNALGLPASIEVFPKPGDQNTIGEFSVAGEYEIHIPYHSRGVLLSGGGNQENYLTKNEDLALYIEEFASAKAMLFNHDYKNGEIMLVQAKATLKEAKKIEKRRKVPVLKWTPRRDVHAPRRQRRAV